MQIVANKGLLLKVREPAHILETIPKSRKVGKHEVLVNWGLEEVMVLRNLGIRSVPSPIIGRYHWPGMYTPMAHQKEAASFMTLNRRCFNFSEQGTSKTASALWAADYLMQEGFVRRALVVCPLSVMQTAWMDDMFRTVLHRTGIVAHHTDKRRRVKALEAGTDFVVINYDGVGLIRDELQKQDFDLIIADEANMLKNVSTDRWKFFNSLVRHDTWLWLMTGTPAAQSPEDAYGLARLVNPTAVPKFAGAFRDQVMYKVTKFKWVPKSTAKETVHRVLQPAIRFTKEECLDLPERTYVTRQVPMTGQQRKYYEMLRKKMQADAAGETITAVHAAANLNKLLQVSTGAAYTDGGDVVEFDARPRVAETIDIIQNAGHKTLVFAPFRHTIETLEKALKAEGISSGTIHGGVPATTRATLIQAFQTSADPHVLLLQPQAAAHGITLTAADTIVWYGPTSSVETYLQANDRAHRKGQRNPVTVFHIESSPVEARMYQLLRENVKDHTALIALYKEEVGLT